MAHVQAEADAAWFAAEAQRREALLAAERDTLKAAEQVARHKLEETEAALRLAGGQAALLERRRTMEAVNAEEEVQVRFWVRECTCSVVPVLVASCMPWHAHHVLGYQRLLP